MTRLSIIVPVLNEQETVGKFYTAVSAIHKTHFPTIQIEYWFIDDGSIDRTLAVIEKLQAVDADVHYVSFSRNFGKEAALFAGLQKAEGDLVAIMDVDLPVSYTHLRAHETDSYLVCRLLLEKKKKLKAVC